MLLCVCLGACVVCICDSVCLHVGVGVCVCVCVRERERETDLGNAVRVGEHGFEVVVYTDVVEDAHSHLLVALIIWETHTPTRTHTQAYTPPELTHRPQTHF